MVVCPTCGNAQSLRAANGARQCSRCYTVYELPAAEPRRVVRRQPKPAPVFEPEPTSAEEEE